MQNVTKELDAAGVVMCNESTPPPLYDGSNARKKDGPTLASLVGHC